MPIDSELAPERQEPPDDANALAWGVALFWQGLEARSVDLNAETLAFARREMSRLAAREPADFLRRILEQIAERFCAVIKVPEARARLAILRDGLCLLSRCRLDGRHLGSRGACVIT